MKQTTKMNRDALLEIFAMDDKNLCADIRALKYDRLCRVANEVGVPARKLIMQGYSTFYVFNLIVGNIKNLLAENQKLKDLLLRKSQILEGQRQLDLFNQVLADNNINRVKTSTGIYNKRNRK